MGAWVTLTLRGGTFIDNITNSWHYVSASSPWGARWDVKVGNVERLSDTEIRVQLEFDDDFDHDSTIIFTIRSASIKDYNGSNLTDQKSVTATTESLIVTSPASLTEATLHNSTVTLRLQGRTFEDDIRNYVSVYRYPIISLGVGNVERLSNTEIRGTIGI